MKEKILFAFLVIGLAAIFILSGDGFFRYPCQDPAQWLDEECKPPLCTARKNCPEDLVGGTNE